MSSLWDSVQLLDRLKTLRSTWTGKLAELDDRLTQIDQRCREAALSCRQLELELDQQSQLHYLPHSVTVPLFIDSNSVDLDIVSPDGAPLSDSDLASSSAKLLAVTRQRNVGDIDLLPVISGSDDVHLLFDYPERMAQRLCGFDKQQEITGKKPAVPFEVPSLDSSQELLPASEQVPEAQQMHIRRRPTGAVEIFPEPVDTQLVRKLSVSISRPITPLTSAGTGALMNIIPVTANVKSEFNQPITTSQVAVSGQNSSSSLTPSSSASSADSLTGLKDLKISHGHINTAIPSKTRPQPSRRRSTRKPAAAVDSINTESAKEPRNEGLDLISSRVPSVSSQTMLSASQQSLKESAKSTLFGGDQPLGANKDEARREILKSLFDSDDDD